MTTPAFSPPSTPEPTFLAGGHGGYEVRRQGARLLFIYRPTLVPGMAALVLGLVAFILTVNLITCIVLWGWLASLLLAALAALVWTGCIVLYRGYAAAAETPLEALAQDTLVADLKSQTLSLGGRTLAPLSHVLASIRFNLFDSTRGLTYHVDLRWPGGSRRALKYMSRADARAFVNQLRGYGFGSKWRDVVRAELRLRARPRH